DHDGAFVIESLRHGAYRLFVSHPAWLPDRDTVAQVSAGGAESVEIELTPGGALSGIVVDEEGRPVAGTRIEARPSRVPAATGSERRARKLEAWLDGAVDDSESVQETGADGRFRIVSLAREPYDIEARHESFLPLFYAGVVPGTEDERLVLAAGSSLGGRIVDPEGDPVEGAKVRIRLGREREVHRLFLADDRF